MVLGELSTIKIYNNTKQMNSRNIKGILEAIQRNKIDIYVNAARVKKSETPYTFVRNYFLYNQPATYFVENKQKQCKAKARRSFIDLYWLTKHYFDITPNDLVKILDHIFRTDSWMACNACGKVGGIVFRKFEESNYNYSLNYKYSDYRLHNEVLSLKEIFKLRHNE